MKAAIVLGAALATASSFPSTAQQQPTNTPQQQTSPSGQPGMGTQTSPGMAPQNNPGMQNPAASQPAAAPEATASQTNTIDREMRPVNGELVGKLDSTSAKAGDNVVVKTKEDIKIADGTDIPKGSKLVGRVTGVQPRGQGKDNSQIAIRFDHAELNGGQNLPIQSEIQAIAPANNDSNSSANTTGAPMASTVPAGSASTRTASSNNGMGSTASNNSGMNGSTGASRPNGASTGTEQSGAMSQNGSAPAAGTVVSRNGNIAIRTTAISGLLIANNAPGQTDPRMASASGILLGAKSDIHLDGGTQVVLGVSASGAPAAGAATPNR